jgi:hypothetical protein
VHAGGGGGGGGGGEGVVVTQMPPVQMPRQHSMVRVQGKPFGWQAQTDWPATVVTCF